ncbi:MAG: chitobiase/beta-hexosaminidase C-terminal domain-containing protein [Muribaculaceae bacterium]
MKRITSFLVVLATLLTTFVAKAETAPDQLYIIGNLPEGSWKTNVGIPMVKEGNTFVAKNATLADGDGNGNGYFSFVTVLAETDSNWDLINANRYGAAYDNYQISAGGSADMSKNTNSWKIAAGTYDIKADFDAMTITVTEPASVATPVITCSKYNYVFITCDTEGASIFYTTDSTEPTTASMPYTNPFEITSDCVVKAIAVKDGLENSEVATIEATVKEISGVKVYVKVNSPGFTPKYIYAWNVEYPNTGSEEFALTPKWSGYQFTEEDKVWLDDEAYYLYAFKDKDGNGYYGLMNVIFNDGSKQTVDIAVNSWTKVYTISTDQEGGKYKVTENTPTGVEAIESEDADAPVEYYSIQGMKVYEPQNGIFIKKQGKKVEKVIIK